MERFGLGQVSMDLSGFESRNGDGKGVSDRRFQIFPAGGGSDLGISACRTLRRFRRDACLQEEMYYLPNQPVIHLFGEDKGHASERRMEERDGTLVCRSRTADGLTVRLSGREEVLRAEALFPFCDPETFRFSQEAALLMARMFEIYPNRISAGQDSFEAYELVDIDLEPVGKAFARETVTFSQTTLLTSHGADNFRQVLGETLEMKGDKDGQEPYGRGREMLEEKEGSLPLSKQADGFHTALGMEQKVPMMPIVQIGEASRALSEKMGRLLKETDSLPVCDASFLPVRAGAMKLLRVRLGRAGRAG